MALLLALAVRRAALRPLSPAARLFAAAAAAQAPAPAASPPASSSSSPSSSSSAAGAADSVVHVNVTMNNIVVSVSTLDGNVVSRCSGGVLGLRHRQRASPAAGTDIARSAAQKAFERGFRVSRVHLKGPARARGQVLRGLQAGGLRVADIRDVTPMPTNGCRPKAARRL